MKVIIEGLPPVNVQAEAVSTPSVWFDSRELAGYKFSLVVHNQSHYDQLQALQDKAAAVEGDERKYSVKSVAMRRSQTTNGRFIEADFEIVLVEVEPEPNIERIELNGLLLTLLGYRVSRTEKATVHTFLVELAGPEFDSLETILDDSGASLRLVRIGADAEPIECRLGGANYWSRVAEENSGAFHRILNLVVDHRIDPPTEGLSSRVRASNLEDQVETLAMQMKYLLQRLGDKLTPGDLEVLGSPVLLRQQVGSQEFWTTLDAVKDAREWYRGMTE